MRIAFLQRDSRVRRVARAAHNLFPFTLLGLVVLPSAGAATWFLGFKQLDLVVLAMGTAALAVGALALVLVVATSIVIALALRRARKGEGLRLECGVPAPSGFAMSSLWFLPLVDVRWNWVTPRARVDLRKKRGRQHETVTAQRRGFVETVARRIEIADAFRLTKIVLDVSEPRRVRALPSMGALKQVNVLRSLASGDDHYDPMGQPEGDRSDLRAYVPGDPVRFILWRVFAKTRQIVVRTPERAVSVARRAYAYLVVDDADEPAAGVARVAIESGTLGSDWAFGADGCDDVAETRARAAELLAESAHCPEARRGAGLTAFLQRHASGASRVVVFVPAAPGPWLARVVSAAHARGQSRTYGPPMEFIVCTDGIVPRMKKSLQSRLVVDDANEKKPADEPSPEDAWTRTDEGQLEAVIAALSATRARVRLVDRRAGRLYDSGALSTLAPSRSRAATSTKTATATALKGA